MKYNITKISGPFGDGSKLRGQMFEVSAESSDEMYPDMQLHVRLQQGDKFPTEMRRGAVITLEVSWPDG